MTPVSTWAPAFHWLRPEDFTTDTIISTFHDGARCRLCEDYVPWGIEQRRAHVAAHRREFEQWIKSRAARVRREAADRLRVVNQERRLTERTVGARTR